jgi:hypothetical protein
MDNLQNVCVGGSMPPTHIFLPLTSTQIWAVDVPVFRYHIARNKLVDQC